MKQRILLLLLLIFASIGNSVAQQLMTHKGELNGGNETYTYFTDNDEEVRQGAYSYIRSDSNSDGATSEQTIKGQYVKGCKDGVWRYTFKQVDVENGSNNYVTATTTMTMNYKNGMPNGVWEYSESGKRRKRNYTLLGWNWGNYVATDPTNISTTFSDGVMVGDVTYKTPWVDVKGKLDSEGWHTGIWKINKQGATIDFTNRISLHEPKDKELTALQRKVAVLPQEEREAFCLDNSLLMQLMPSKNFFDINDGYFNKSMWLHREIGGDKTYATEDGLNYKDSKKYGQYYFVDRAKYRSLNSINSYWKNRNTTELSEMLEQHKHELSKVDQHTLRNAIEALTIVDKIDAKFSKPRDLYYELSNFTTPNRSRILRNLLPAYNKIVAATKANLNAAVDVEVVNNITRSLYIKPNGQFSYNRKSYSESVDYWAYLAKVEEIAPIINNFADSLQGLNLLYDELSKFSVGIPTSFNSRTLSTQLGSILQSQLDAEVAELERYNTIAEATTYAKTMLLMTSAISQIDKSHSSLEKYITSTPKKIVKIYYKIAEEVLGQLSTTYNYATLRDLYDAASKVESLVDTDTKTLEKMLAKEKGIDGKIRILLGR